MKKLFFCLAILLNGWGIQAQRLLLTTFAGVSNYQGDLQDKKFTFQESNIAGGIGVAYEITDQLYATANIKFGKLSASDKFSSKNASRNLSFSAPLSQFQIGLEYDLFNLKEHLLTPYFFAGLAAYHFNPSTLDSAGNKVYLQPLGTEGQGFYNGRTKYNLTQISIPLGIGIKYALNDNIRLGLEIGFSKLFTDYIDDVSATYVDQASLLTNNGPKAVELAFRGNEINPGASYPPDGSSRGNPSSKDSYYFSGLTVSFRIAGSEYGGNGGKSKTDCPKNVY